jgi:hypothetical protein
MLHGYGSKVKMVVLAYMMDMFMGMRMSEKDNRIKTNNINEGHAGRKFLMGESLIRLTKGLEKQEESLW